MDRKHVKIAAVAAALLAGTTGFAYAQRASGGGSAEMERRSGPRMETTTRSGGEMREQHGANQRNFCPPGQKKKAGKGSAFQC